jgi:deoxyribonuclease V
LRHAWNIDLKEAREIQSYLAQKVKHTSTERSIQYIAGFDIAYCKASKIAVAGMVVLSYPSLEIIDQTVQTHEISFPYIPGFLSFREAPALMALIDLYHKPIDLFVFDGHGIAHPRGLGIAAHIGVLMDKSAIGCAKKKLVGNYEMPDNKVGASRPLIYKEKIIGQVLRTKVNVKPVFVSVGHLISLEAASALILDCVHRYRLPEPTRLAHNLVSSYRKRC